MFDYVEIEATVIPFEEFAAVQVAIMQDTAIDEGFESLDSWALARPGRFEEVSQEIRQTYRVYNLK
jgi:hypothetical protein